MKTIAVLLISIAVWAFSILYMIVMHDHELKDLQLRIEKLEKVNAK